MLPVSPLKVIIDGVKETSDFDATCGFFAFEDELGGAYAW